MSYSVINSIKRGVISPVYLFYGTERYLIKETLQKLYEALVPEGIGDFNYEKLDGAQVSPAFVATSASTLPVFAEKRLIIVTDAPWFGSKKNGEEEAKDNFLEPLLNYLGNPADTTCLVFVAGEKVDTRKKIVKAVGKGGEVIQFAAFKGNDLNRWIEGRFQERGKNVEGAAVDYLTAAVGNDLTIINNEIEKAVVYSGENSKITLEDIKQTVSKTSTLSIFDLVDAVATRKSVSAVRQLREMVRFGEAEIKILFMVVRQFRMMLQAQTLNKQGYAERQIADNLSGHPYVIKKALQQSRNFSPQELVRALEILLDTDVAIKTGKGEPLALLETGILRLCSSNSA